MNILYLEDASGLALWKGKFLQEIYFKKHQVFLRESLNGKEENLPEKGHPCRNCRKGGWKDHFDQSYPYKIKNLQANRDPQGSTRRSWARYLSLPSEV